MYIMKMSYASNYNKFFRKQFSTKIKDLNTNNVKFYKLLILNKTSNNYKKGMEIFHTSITA